MIRAQFAQMSASTAMDCSCRPDLQPFSRCSISYKSLSDYYHLPYQLRVNFIRPTRQQFGSRSKSVGVIISCKSSSSLGGNSNGNDHERDDDYVEAIVLVSETLRHYRMHIQGYQEEIKWKFPMFPFSVQGMAQGANFSTIGPGILRRYRSPTIFLRISCDGDFLLPIIVGEFAVENLINSSQEDKDYPNQYQLMRNIVEKLGYDVKMVRITERVNNVYFACMYFHKSGTKDIIRVNARPSDAINVAKRCQAPIFVNKQIVLTDALRIVHGMGRSRDSKPIYDVSLDSATDGPDSLAEELDIVNNINLAIKEERYNDAAIWRDKLLKLRDSSHEL